MILASKSAQRNKLMKMLFDEYKVASFDTDETFQNDLSVYENIKNIAYEKALSVINNSSLTNEFILGVDTVVYFENKILLKPVDYDDAFNMIKSYKDKEQEVISGISLIKVENGDITDVKKDFVISTVKFNSITDEKIARWLDLDLYKNCSGSFMIEKVQNDFDMQITGSYSNVIGLPLEKLKEYTDEYNIQTLSTNISDIELIKKYMIE